MKVLSTDFDEIYEDIIETIGVDNFVELCKLRGGMVVYFPVHSRAIREARNREIVKKFNGVNFVQLAKEYKLSESYLRRLLKSEG
ncbi:MAG: Mor transcription activator family protein, partial [Cellulosilyticaceae bacterium]